MDNFYYLACSSFIIGKQCMKKIIPTTTNIWHCPKCNVDIVDCDYRYLLKIDLQDHTGEILSSIAFEDVASSLMGITSTDLHLMSLESDAIEEIVSKVQFTQHLFTLSAKQETFQDIQHLKVIIMR